ncbi:MAG: hypothetical protein QM236_07620 [Bacillota bacterium]|jgi:signal peptidase I|nr:hypothetical protein [Bacillota bacterium]
MRRRMHGRLLVILILLMVLTVSLTACSQAVPESADRISSPVNLEIPAAGTWVLERRLLDDTTEAAEADDVLTGETVGFSPDTMLYAGQMFRDISYKIRRVNVHEYFLHKNREILKKLDYENNEIMVVNVYSKDNFLFEFIIDSKGEKIALVDDRYYVMRKVSEEVSDVQEAAVHETLESGIKEAVAHKQPVRSGLLLGVRIPVQTADGLGDFKYGTYWISCINSTLRPVLYTDDIYLPRMDGFWKLEVEKKPGSSGLEDSLRAYKVTNTYNKGGDRPAVTGYRNVSERVETRLRRAILYVGNDYACVENIIYDTDSNTAGAVFEKTLRTLPVDNLSNVDGIKISDMAGENGAMAMENAIAEVLANSGYEGIVIIDDDAQQKNFALYRKTGHWFFKGRIDPDRQGHLPYMDFNLNLLPPANMVAYDVLHVPWKEMKDKLPNAIDIYTSPNRDLAVILTRSHILLYTIEGRKLSGEPIAKIRLEEGSTVIMAEWSMGEYVARWENSFIKNNDTHVVFEGASGAEAE